MASISALDRFVTPQFNVIIPSVVCLALRLNVGGYVSWLVDACAAVYLIGGTLYRALMWDTQAQVFVRSPAAVLMDEHVEQFSHYFIFCLASWIAAFMLDFKTCVYILNPSLMGRLAYRGGFLYWVKLIFAVLSGANSVIVMLHLCSDVHKTFEYVTKDTWLISYYWAAAVSKIVATFLQGVFCSSWIVEHDVEFLPKKELFKRKVMARLNFVNIVNLVHMCILTVFGIFDGGPLLTWNKMARVCFFLLDAIYRISLCYWYYKNSYLCLSEYFKNEHLVKHQLSSKLSYLHDDVGHRIYLCDWYSRNYLISVKESLEIVPADFVSRYKRVYAFLLNLYRWMHGQLLDLDQMQVKRQPIQQEECHHLPGYADSELVVSDQYTMAYIYSMSANRYIVPNAVNGDQGRHELVTEQTLLLN